MEMFGFRDTLCISFFFSSVKNGEQYENKTIGDLIPVMVITKTKLALEKIYFLKLIFSFSVLVLIVYFDCTSALGL